MFVPENQSSEPQRESIDIADNTMFKGTTSTNFMSPAFTELTNKGTFSPRLEVAQPSKFKEVDSREVKRSIERQYMIDYEKKQQDERL